MSIDQIIPPLLPHFNELGNISISQSLSAAVLGNLLFFVVIFVYYNHKKKWKNSFFRQCVEYFYEMVYEFLANIWWHATNSKVLTFTTTLFFFVLWNNLFWLMGDMIVLVWPAAHHRFRPATTDMFFNGIMAVATIFGMFIYGFAMNWPWFIKKYLPVTGMWLVEKVDKRWKVITKLLDILLWLLIGIIELLSDLWKMLSLTLRLFWNMFVGMLLLTLLLFAMKSLPVPFLWPIVIFAYETAISLLQAMIFAVLATVYFRLAWESNH